MPDKLDQYREQLTIAKVMAQKDLKKTLFSKAIINKTNTKSEEEKGSSDTSQVFISDVVKFSQILLTELDCNSRIYDGINFIHHFSDTYQRVNVAHSDE